MDSHLLDPDDDVTVVGDHELVVELRRLAGQALSPSGRALPPPALPAPEAGQAAPTPTLPAPVRTPHRGPGSPAGRRPRRAPADRSSRREAPRHEMRRQPPRPGAAFAVGSFDEWCDDEDRPGWTARSTWALVALVVAAVIVGVVLLR